MNPRYFVKSLKIRKGRVASNGHQRYEATGKIGRITFRAHRWIGGMCAGKAWKAEASRELSIAERMAIGKACEEQYWTNLRARA